MNYSPTEKRYGTSLVPCSATPAARGYVSLRSFEEGATKSFRITSVGLDGGPGFLVTAATDDAFRAANAPQRVVFAPPLAVFLHPDNAKQSNLLAGLALSVECDQH